MKLNYPKKVLIFSITIFLVVLILNIIFVNLLLNKVRNINAKVSQLEISSAERLKEINLKDSISNSEIEREKLNTYFVGAGNVETVEFTKFLEKLALENGVTQQKTLSYEPLPNFGGAEILSGIRYKMNISGRFTNVYNFLLAIENLAKVSGINNVSFNLNSNNNSTKEAGAVWSGDLDFFVVKLK
jgi:hypothetical protein